MSQFHTLTIKNIERLTSQAVTLTFEVPQHLKDIYKFKSGQYITIKTVLNGTEIRRDYSLCSSPKSEHLKVAVKQVKDGTFSAYVNNELKIGDQLEIAAPRGHFVFQPNDFKTKHIAAFAAGSGITPILSIVKCALEEEVLSNVVLVYGNKTRKKMILFLDVLREARSI